MPETALGSWLASDRIHVFSVLDLDQLNLLSHSPVPQAFLLWLQVFDSFAEIRGRLLTLGPRIIFVGKQGAHQSIVEC